MRWRSERLERWMGGPRVVIRSATLPCELYHLSVITLCDSHVAKLQVFLNSDVFFRIDLQNKQQYQLFVFLVVIRSSAAAYCFRHPSFACCNSFICYIHILLFLTILPYSLVYLWGDMFLNGKP